MYKTLLCAVTGELQHQQSWPNLRHYPILHLEGLRKDHKNCQYSKPPAENLHLKLPKYEIGGPTTKLQISVTYKNLLVNRDTPLFNALCLNPIPPCTNRHADKASQILNLHMVFNFMLWLI